MLLGQVELMTDGGLDKINFTSENKSQRHLSGALRQRRDFLFVQHKGVRQVMTHFILQAAVKPASTASQPALSYRTGVTASKKVGNAVARNRAKRRMRALFASWSVTMRHLAQIMCSLPVTALFRQHGQNW